jgi:hypothetical protein
MLKQVILSFALMITGCAAAPRTDPAASVHHPANPNAPESPVPAPSQTLMAPARGPSSTSAPAPESPDMDHDMNGMEHMHHGDHQ